MEETIRTPKNLTGRYVSTIIPLWVILLGNYIELGGTNCFNFTQLSIASIMSQQSTANLPPSVSNFRCIELNNFFLGFTIDDGNIFIQSENVNEEPPPNSQTRESLGIFEDATNKALNLLDIRRQTFNFLSTDDVEKASVSPPGTATGARAPLRIVSKLFQNFIQKINRNFARANIN